MEQPDVTIFKALAAEPRARIVSLLSGRCLCAGALACMLDISPGAVSQHLNALKECGLVTFERRGYYMHYKITEDARERVEEVLDTLFNKSAVKGKKESQSTKNCSCSGHKSNTGKKLNPSRRKGKSNE
ncbi:MAG: ArsR/SmtB family transcription factor [Chitinivibrionales bacterium]